MQALTHGGAETVVLTALKHLDRSRFELFLVTLDKDGPRKDEVPYDVGLTELGTERVRNSGIALYKALKHIKPDIVFSTLWHTSSLLLILKMIMRPKWKVVVREASVLMGIWQSPLVSLQGWLYRRADKIVAQTSMMRERLIILTGTSPKNILVLSNPVDRPSIQKRAHLVPNPLRGPRPWVLYLGRKSEEKDLPTLLKAFRIFNQNRGGTLFLVGKDSLNVEKRNELGYLAKTIEEAVHWQDAVSNPFPYIVNADMLILSSRHDSFPNVLLEAGALGIPVVSTNCPDGPGEIVVHEKTGLLVPVGDPNSMAHAMDRLSQPNRPFDQEFTKNHINKFSIESFTASLTKLLISLK